MSDPEMKNIAPSNAKSRKKMILGIIVLLVTDIIWVVSAELSEYIFHEKSFNKPFFTTYFKSSMFIIYLFGFTFIRRWQYQCISCYSKTNSSHKLLQEVERVSTQEPSNFLSVSGNVSRSSSPMLCDGNFTPPRFESMTDDDLSSVGEADVDQRTVSFSSVREVRSLSKRHNDAQILARMSQNSVEVLKNILLDVHKKLPLQETVKLSVTFAILWMFATLMYQEALSRTSAAVTNILSSTSGIFTLLLGALFPSSNKDKFTISKLFAVLISFSGIIIVCWTDPSRKDTEFNFGEVYSLLGAILYACYLVMIRRKVGEEDQLDIPLFFGFVGLFGLLIFWPGFLILHYTGQETFELPPNYQTWIYLSVNAIIGTVLSELLWLWGCFLTSSLMATLSLGLVIPLSMVWDMLVNRIKFSWLFLVGIVPILLSFLVVSVLTHYGDWDPVKNYVVKLFCWRNKSKHDENTGLLADSDDQNQQNEPIN